MEKLKFMRPATIFLISILTIVIIISCGNDDEVPPEYVGKWVTEKPIPGTHGFFSVKYYLELTQNDFKETFGTPYSSDT
ncbi:MAG TPA: hypothetical protein P5210_11805, partial [Draconibacterium sp.]|nr:hypothetical protein [Draconibacterium sp.]